MQESLSMCMTLIEKGIMTLQVEFGGNTDLITKKITLWLYHPPEGDFLSSVVGVAAAWQKKASAAVVCSLDPDPDFGGYARKQERTENIYVLKFGTFGEYKS